MPDLPRKKIVLHTMQQIHLVDPGEIIHCEASQAYTIFHLAGGKTIMVSGLLKSYDLMLKSHGFLRVHRSHVINTDHIDHFSRSDGGQVIMNNRKSIPVSTRNRNELLRLFEKWEGQLSLTNVMR